MVLVQTETVEAWTPLAASFYPRPNPDPRRGRIAAGRPSAAVLLDSSQVVRVPTRWIAVQHRSPGTKTDIHLDGGTQLALKGVTGACAQVRLREIHYAVLQSGAQTHGAENGLAACWKS